MILLVHMLFGSTIAILTKNFFLGALLAFLSHYVLDFIPHIEYDIKKIKIIILDFFSGVFLVWMIFYKEPVVIILMFFSIIPDCLTVLSAILPNKILTIHDNIHRKKIHYFKNKKIPNFLRIFSQVFIILLSFFLIIVYYR